MAAEVFNRYEKKYLISDEMYHKIKPLLENYMEVDSHSKNGDFYSIHNIYYDTADNEIIRKSIDKPVYKEKLRLRSYGVVKETDKVYLELKKKYNGKVNKRRTSILLEEAYQFIASKHKPEYRPFMNKQVVNEIEYFLSRYEIIPSIFLAYDRNAMFSVEDKSFRITFDTNIRTRRHDLNLHTGGEGESLLPPGIWIMGAKMDKAFPKWFTDILSEHKLYPNSFSKYGTEYIRHILHRDTVNDRINIITEDEYV